MTITMKGRLSRCLLLAYRTPAESVRGLLPPARTTDGLELMTHGPWAFWNVVVCEVEKMRPPALPTCCGLSYRHAAYRLYVKAATANQGRMRGLYFVRSDADCAAIARGGNLASDFRFHKASIAIDEAEGDATRVNIAETADGIGDAVLRVRSGQGALMDGSCFDSCDEARAMLKYQPLGLSLSRGGRSLKLAEVFRDEASWRESPVDVLEARWSFFESLGQRDVQLELATQVAPIDYRWRLGRRVAMPPGEARPAPFPSLMGRGKGRVGEQ